MNVLAFVLYVVLAILAAALIPGFFVLGREVIRRRRALRAVEDLAAARQVIAQLHHRSPAFLASTLTRRFDRHTIETALEAALSEEAICVEVCEKLGLRARWEKTLRTSRAWNERAHAARMLGKLRAGASSKSLVEALVDPHEDTTVRFAAGQAIGMILDSTVIPHLCSALVNDDERNAPTIAEALVSYGESAVPFVLESLGHDRPATRAWAARILGRIAHPRATMPLMTALSDADPATRAAVAEALGRIGDIRGAYALCSLVLTDPAAPVRACAAVAAAKSGDKDLARSLVFALRDPDAEVRCRATEALAILAPNDWSPLERALFDPCERVRRHAALSLDRLGAVAIWTRALGSSLPEARFPARTALLAIARAGLAQSIIFAAVHEVAAVREAVDDLLQEARREQQSSLSTIALARKSSHVAARLKALHDLSLVASAESTAALAEALICDPSPEARAFAATALAHCKERWLSLPALARALMDPVAEVAQEAARSLAEVPQGERRDRRISDLPPDSNGSLRRSTGRIRARITLV